jgi:hypothetical protein
MHRLCKLCFTVEERRVADGEFLNEPTLIAKLLEGSTYRSDRQRIQSLNLVGAIVETALDSADGVNIDLRQSASLHFSHDPMPARFGRHGLWASFRTSGTGLATKHVNIDVAGIVRSRKTYAISSRYIRIGDRFFEVFYNDDDIVLFRVTGGSLKKLLDTHKLPTPSLSHAWSDQEGSKVSLNVELERGLADRVALHAAEEGLTIDEWLADAAERRFREITPEVLKETAPKSAPNDELYAKRAIKSEKAPDFIKRVYEQWLTGDFTRADLRKIDPQAEMALRNWERTNGRAELNLPTVEERNDRLVAEGRLVTNNPRETRRRAAAALNRLAPRNTI